MNRLSRSPSIQVGDRVVFRVTGHSTHPSLKFGHVTPSQKGEGYAYVIHKFWVVVATPTPELVRVRTRRGKEFEIAANDLRLRRASWAERLFHRDRFPRMEEVLRDQGSLLRRIMQAFVTGSWRMKQHTDSIANV